MALARCESCGRPKGMKHDYAHFHSLPSATARSLLCGSPTCARPGSIWLTEEEERQYLCGQRSFRVSNRSVQVQVT
jgi:hypothetical protein